MCGPVAKSESDVEVAPAPVANIQSHPDSIQSRQNRLEAAQSDTGYRLNDIIRHRNTGEYGKVVGFGRIDAGERVLLVELNNDEEGREIIAADVRVVDHVASNAV